MSGRISSPAFVGRAEELLALEAAWGRAATDEPRVVLVGGEAGVGKPRLVTEFAAGCLQGGGRVLRGGCVPLGGGALPYAPVVEALRALVDDVGEDTVRGLIGPAWPEVARLVPSLGQLEPAPPGAAAQSRLFELLLGLLRRLAEQAPVLVVVEDLHWADQSTRDLLAFLCRNLRRERVLLVVTYRDDEPRSNRLEAYLAELDRGGPVERRQLPRLDRGDTRAQLLSILGSAPPDELLDAIFGRSEGNPFVTEELLQAARVGASQLPATVRGLLRGRVEALPGAAQHLLEVVAVAGRPVSHRLLEMVTGLQDPALDQALGAAVDHRLLVARPGADDYDLRHALLREIVAADLLPGQQARLHAAFARALPALPGAGRSWPATAAEIAVHWDAAGEHSQALAARVTAGLAAEEAHAFAEASQHFQRALELWPLVPEPGSPGGLDRAGLRAHAAEAAASAGATDRAIELLEDALQDLDTEADPVRAATLLGRLGFHRFRGRGEAEALAAYEAAEALFAGQPASAEQARVLGGHAQILMVSLRPHSAIPLCEAAISIARAVGARAEEASALEILGGCMDDLDVEQGIGLHRRAQGLAEEAGDADTIVRTYLNLGYALSLAGREREALQISQEGYQRARDLGLERAGGSFIATNLAWSLLVLGRWDECHQFTTRLLEGDAWNRFGPLAAQGRLLTWRGDFTAARASLEASLRLSPAAFADDAQLALVDLALWEGRHDEAEARITAGLRWCADHDPHGAFFHRSSPWYPVALRLAADRAEQAAARRASDHLHEARRWAAPVVAELDRLAAAPTPQARLPEVVCNLELARAEQSRLQGASSPARWQAAVQGWDRLERLFPASYSRFRQAEAMLAAGTSRSQAERTLRPAHHTAVRLGAAPLRREIEALARRGRLQLTTPPRIAPVEPAPSSPAPFGLTRREAEVLALVAEGRTNRQIGKELFITEKTASIHVSRILTKLGVAGRGEAAATAHRLGLDKR
jgi:DNA-binding NarL/FixJ family response regulator